MSTPKILYQKLLSLGNNLLYFVIKSYREEVQIKPFLEEVKERQ
jgi:hypothetical protein